MVDTQSRSYFEGRIEELVREFIIKQTENIITTNRFLIPFEEDVVYQYFIENPEDFTKILRQKTEIAIRNYNLPIDINKLRIAYDHNFLVISRLRDLKANMIYKAEVFDGVIVGETAIKAYTKKGKSYCKACVRTYDVDLSNEKIELPNCTECKKLTQIDKKSIEYGEMKEVILREPFDESMDRQPSEYSCIVNDVLVKDVFTGKKLRVVGMRGIIFNKKENRHPFYIQILSIDDLGDPKDLYPDQSEIEFFRQESLKSDYESKLIYSFSPDIFSPPNSLLWFVKMSILLFLSTGNAVEGKRQFINLFLCGDPGVGKSTMMKAAIALSPKSMYISGNGASEAGLTAIIEKQADGKFIAKAGILPLCDGGFAAVDEMNLMSKEHQNSLQESMENQFITKAKAVNIQLPSRCGIIGGANPIYGRYDFDRSVIDNLEIAIPLLNRFDLKWNIIDQVDEAQDRAITNHIFSYHQDPEKLLNDVPYSKTQLIKLMNYVRKQEPELTEDVQKRIADFVEKIRKITKDKHSMPIDRRIIESLTRLSVARAKLLLKPKVETSDVDYISNLYLQSLESFGIDTKTDLVQNKFYDTRELNQQQTFDKAFDDCKDKDESVDMVQVIEKLSCTKHFDEYKAKSYFEKMIASRKLYELRSGRWKKVD